MGYSGRTRATALRTVRGSPTMTQGRINRPAAQSRPSGVPAACPVRRRERRHSPKDGSECPRPGHMVRTAVVWARGSKIKRGHGEFALCRPLGVNTGVSVTNSGDSRKDTLGVICRKQGTLRDRPHAGRPWNAHRRRGVQRTVVLKLSLAVRFRRVDLLAGSRPRPPVCRASRPVVWRVMHLAYLGIATPLRLLAWVPETEHAAGFLLRRSAPRPPARFASGP